MRTARILRAAAVGLAATALFDPACVRTRSVRPGVIVRAGSPGNPAASLADTVHDRLSSALRHRIDLDPARAPAAVVLTAPVAALGGLPEGVPVSLVQAAGDARRNVRVAGAIVPHAVVPGLAATVEATIEATGAAGATTEVVLQQQGLPIDRIEHAWTADEEVFEARFVHVPPAPGVRALRILARPLDGEAATADNHADVRLLVQDRRLRVLVYEPRPSWATTFLRRALEDDPVFDVATLARPSRGIARRAGEAPARLRADTLEPFDAIVVGAPEELTAPEVEALDEFARRRGGSLVLAPDRRPTGGYARLVPAAAFEERLLESPVALRGGAGVLTSGELLVPVRPGEPADALAWLEEADGRRVPVVFGWPLGIGRAIFSGALDAWRHREPDDGFAAFWRAQVAGAALGSPPRVSAALEPGTAAPGDPIVLTVRVRPTEARREGGALEFPPVAAQLTRPDGGVEALRVWPLAEAGAFEARFSAPAAGASLVRAAVPGASFETTLIVAESVRTARADLHESARLLAASSGGVTAAAADLSALVDHLASLPVATEARRVHPARSPWWMAAFAALVCVEWALRRRKGRR